MAPAGAGLVDIISYGHSMLRSSRAVAATAVESEHPYLPAAIYSNGDGALLELGDDFYVHGADGSVDDDTPAVALDDDADVDVFLQYLREPARERLRGPAGSPSVRRRGFGSLASMSALLANLATTRFLDGAIQGPLGWGIALSPRSARLTDASGGGILIVDGDLSIGGRFEFKGLVIVRGNVEADSDSSMELKGALLQESPGRDLDLGGEGEIRYDPESLALLDSLAPDALPRRALVGGWREHH
jgi:hypothetical protein